LHALDYVIRDSLFNITKAIIRLLPYITFPEYYQIILLHFFLTFIPRLLLLILFILDLFYFKKLELMYMYIWLGFIPLAITYVKYILTQTLEDYTLYLEPLYEAYVIPINEEQKKEWADMHHNDGTDYRSYAISIRDLRSDMLCTYEGYKYGGIPNLSVLEKDYPDELLYVDGHYDEIPGDIKEVAKGDFNELMPLILILDAFLTDYDITIKMGNGPTHYEIRFNIIRRYLLKDWNIGIYSVYLICWIYILVISLSTFTMPDLDLSNFQDNMDPFTNLIIDIDYY